MAHLSLTQLFPTSLFSEETYHHTLGEEFYLSKNGNMVFHWADFHETCDTIKAHLENDETLMEDYRTRQVALKRLGLISVWIKTSQKVHQITMKELYGNYILNQSHFMGLDPFGGIDISFISSTGPFKSMSISECFNKSTYRDFVMLFLLEGKLPRRDFRLRLKAKILMEHGPSFEHAHLIQLEQLTTNGLLLSMDAESLSKVAKTGQLRLLIDTKVLGEGSRMSLPDLQAHLDQYAFNLLYSSKKEDALVCDITSVNVQSSFDFLKNNKSFLFIPYSKLTPQGAHGIKDIQKFIQHTREIVRDHYRQLSSDRSA